MFRVFWNRVKSFFVKPIIPKRLVSDKNKDRIAITMPTPSTAYDRPKLKKMKVGHSMHQSHFGTFSRMKPLMANRRSISNNILGCKHRLPYGTRELSGSL